MIRMNPWTVNGLEVKEIVFSEGMKHNRIVNCHIDVKNQENYFFCLLDMGVYVEFDNFGKEYYVDREV